MWFVLVCFASLVAICEGDTDKFCFHFENEYRFSTIMEFIHENPMVGSGRNTRPGDIEMKSCGDYESVEPSTSRQHQEERIENVAPKYNKAEESSKSYSRSAVTTALLATILILNLSISVVGVIYITQHAKDQQSMRIPENSEKNLTSMTSKAHASDQQQGINLENMEKNITSIIEKMLEELEDFFNKLLDSHVKFAIHATNEDGKTIAETTKVAATTRPSASTTTTHKTSVLMSGWKLWPIANSTKTLQYKIFNLGVNYTTAEENCTKSGGRLAATIVRESPREVWNSAIITGQHGYWIGLQDRIVEGSFQWADNATYMKNETHWGARQPDNHEKNEDCVEIRKNGFLNDNVCRNTRSGFICEADFQI